MADEKISQLTDGGAPLDTDQLVIARSGSSLSLLFSAIKAAIPGGVASVFGRTGAVVAANGDYTAAQVGALPSTETLDQIATANVTAANWSNNSHKITSLANGVGAQDAAAFGQIPTALPPNGTAGGDLSGTYPNPSVAPAANVAMGSHKLTGLAAGTTNGDSVRFEQIPTALPPNGTAGGDLSGTYPNPAVKAVTETSGPTDLTIGTIADGQFLKRTGSTLVSGAVMSNPLTTKGDIIIEDASPAPARLAIGSTGQVLNVASGLPAWTTPGMVLLYSATLGSNSASFDTGSNAIAAGFTNLLVVLALKTNRAAGYIDDIKMIFNGDTGSNYDYVQVFATNGNAAGTQAHGVAFVDFIVPGANGSTQNYFSATRFTIPNYASTSFWKTGTGDTNVIDTANTQQANQQFQFGWRSTAAINQMAFSSANAANLETGCTISVYGLK